MNIEEKRTLMDSKRAVIDLTRRLEALERVMAELVARPRPGRPRKTPIRLNIAESNHGTTD